MGLINLETGKSWEPGREETLAKVQERLLGIAEDTIQIAELAAVLVRQLDADWEVGAGYWRAEETKSAIEALRQALVARRLLPGQAPVKPPLRLLITSAEARLLEATIAVRRAIDEHCQDGAITSDHPRYAELTALFERLHLEEEVSWRELQRERGA